MHIRRMSIEDYEAAYKLWTATEGMGLRSLDDSREGIQRFLERNPDSNFVCHMDDDLAGVILSGHDGRRAYIYHAVVNPRYRGQGIGTKLVDAVVEAMQAEQIHKICLVVFKENQIGNDFWEAIGFQDRQDLTYRNKSINDTNV